MSTPPRRRQRRTKGRIGGGDNPLMESPSNTAPVSPLADATWPPSTPAPPQSEPLIDTDWLLAEPVPEDEATGPLTSAEHAALATAEAELENLRRAFISAGRALTVIRNGHLYRESAATFEEYVESRWGMQRAHAYRLIAAWPLGAAVTKEVGATNEAQVRELLPVADKHGQDAAIALYRTLADADVRLTAAVIAAVRQVLPDQWDDKQAIERVRAFLAGEIGPPQATGGTTLAADFRRLDALASRVKKHAAADPAEARRFAAQLRALADQLEKQA